MKLFKSTEIITNKEAQASFDIKRFQTINSEIQRKEAELKRLELDFEFVLENQRKVMNEEVSILTHKKEALQTEIANLEQTRKNNLTPLELRKEELDKFEILLDKKNAKLSIMLEEFDVKTELLQDKLDEVGAREIELRQVALKQKNTQLSIDQQKESISKQLTELNFLIEKMHL